jgi:Tfp pilus assembly protein PilO
MTGADLLALAKKQPIGVVCGLVCLVCAALLYFRSDKIGEARQLLEQKTKEDQKVVANVRNAAGLPQHLEEMQAVAKQLDSRLVRASQLALNQQFFYRLESETGVKLIDVRQNALPAARPGAAKTLYAAIAFNISIQGTFKQVMDFLEHLEKGAHLARFNNINFSKTDAASASDTMVVTFAIELLGTP